MGKLTRRADYLAANGGLRAPTPGFVLLVRPRGDADPAIRLGITVSKKVGGAVIRNRMKRRFRALARAVLPEAGLAGADHVLVGRAGGIERPFAELRAELESALDRLKRKAAEGPPHHASHVEQVNRSPHGSALSGGQGDQLNPSLENRGRKR